MKAWKMAGVQKAKSEETRRRVLEAAVDVMREGGLGALQIREVATRAGYAVGSVYKHFADLDELIIAVNSITLDEIARVMLDAASSEAKPVERLKRLAHAYLKFAEDNANAWRGLFSHHLPEGQSTPDIHKQKVTALLSLIADALQVIDPELEDGALDVRARTCFGAMHGLVSIALEDRFVGLEGEVLKVEMDYVVERLCGRAV
jgi:AcrR family transcriptional regulator